MPHPFIRSESGDPVSAGFITFWFTSLFFGAAFLLIVTVTAFVSKKIHRMSSWYNFCLSWFILALSFSLLAFSPKGIGAEPPVNLCLTQAGLVYAAPVLTSWSGASLVLQLWWGTSALVRTGKEEEARRRPEGQLLFLLIFPHTLYAIVLVINFQISLANFSPQNVGLNHEGTYCVHNNTSIPALITATLVSIAMIIMFVFEGLCIRHHYKAYRAFGYLEAARPSQVLLFRVVGMTVLVIGILLICLIRAFDRGLLGRSFDSLEDGFIALRE
ncbi:hypothetical protein PUNSTDRAFT_135521 [Punctularia strigosozonata HHB-11173 SS5]|uniref:uncharacterized protein n=1 Tax=Punctularia strigosozonata (strain HHB-11173) TaxID=741275 RepID=UPI0004416E73|nr:uncharacterized protein PUNSTDRAFT_135521 [Punctularia strigosozonata HHB-11173 SS5]EIN08004.1 hypothetical protein PUNSTDRAFT_135521 [Punctularia strigosozonata HHB-11173 SS5]